MKVLLFLLLVATVAGENFLQCVAPDLNITTRNILSCCYDGIYRVNATPNPYDCQSWIQCVPRRANNGQFITIPVPQDCPMGTDGQPLYYDFRHCNFAQGNTDVCFDPSKHGNAEFFICTSPFEGNTVPCPF